MLAILTSILLTLLALGAILLAAVYKLWHNPPLILLPPIRVEGFGVTVDLANFPQKLHVVTEAQVPAQSSESNGEIVPEAIFEYCQQESEPHARDTMLQRVRSLRRELGSWPAAFSQLQKENNPQSE